MQNRLKHMAELYLIYAVPVVTNAKEHSRLSGLQKRLQKRVLKTLDTLPNHSEEDADLIINVIKQWGKETGWLDNSKHIGTLASFCVTMMEQSTFNYDPKLYEILTDIIDHLVQGKAFYPASITAGQIAADKWYALLHEKEIA